MLYRIGGLFLLFTLILGQTTAAAAENEYDYKRSRRAVALLNEAVAEIEEKGRGAFEEFARPGSQWFHEDTYLFVYTMEGVSLFHPVQEHLRGENLYNLTDANDNPIVQNLIHKAKAGGGWVHYLWARPGEFIPTWKSAYVRKAVMPDGAEVFVGTGVYNLPAEKQFIVQMVDDAAALIRTEEKVAFEVLRSHGGPFSFRDSYIFVFKGDGTAVVDPAFPHLEGRNLLQYDIVRRMISGIEGRQTAWVSYMRAKPGEVHPSKKLAYLRAISIGEERFIVGADFFPPKPIWMR